MDLGVFCGSNRGVQLLYILDRRLLTGRLLVGSFGRDTHGAVREERDTHLNIQINPGNQWDDRCCTISPSHVSNYLITGLDLLNQIGSE